LNIAIIGAGRIGKIHAGNAAGHPALSVKYVVDPIAEAAEQLASQVGAQSAGLDQALSDRSVEGVVIASSTDTHLDFSIGAVEAGKAVFCEKPIDLDLGKARAASAVLGAPAARFFLGFNRRFDPHFARLQEQLRAEEIGRLETLHIVSHDPAPPPVDYIKVSGGLFRDMTIHDFDMARWLLGEEPIEVYAAGACLVDPAIAAAGDIDTAKVLLRTASGRLCVISNSRRSGYGYDQRVEAFCSNGLLRVGNVHDSTLESWGESGPQGSPLQNFFLDRYAQAYRAEMDHFAGVIARTHEPLVGHADGIAALGLAEAANRSLEKSEVAEIRG
jgi:myo-inositol 2-dehydrogenase/D-chiro-inositol 1-dehydrogenase